VALEAINVVLALLGLSVGASDRTAASHALGVVLLIVVRLAPDAAILLVVRGERLAANVANPALFVVFPSLYIDDRGSTLDVRVAGRADVKSLLVAVRAVVRAGMRLEEVVVQKLLVARRAEPALGVVLVLLNVNVLVRH